MFQITEKMECSKTPDYVVAIYTYQEKIKILNSGNHSNAILRLIFLEGKSAEGFLASFLDCSKKINLES